MRELGNVAATISVIPSRRKSGVRHNASGQLTQRMTRPSGTTKLCAGDNWEIRRVQKSPK